MPNLRADELSPLQREVIEGILGCALDRGENVELRAYPAASRDEAHRRLSEHMERMAKRVENVPVAELYAEIDEAIQYVRQHPE